MEVINGVQGVRNRVTFGGKLQRNWIRVLNWGLGFLLFGGREDRVEKILLVLLGLEPGEEEKIILYTCSI